MKKCLIITLILFVTRINVVNAMTNSVTLTVTNVENISAYVKLTNFLQSIALIKQVNIIAVGVHQVAFNLVTTADNATLIRALTLRHYLIPIANVGRNTNFSELYYQWSS